MDDGMGRKNDRPLATRESYSAIRLRLPLRDRAAPRKAIRLHLPLRVLRSRSLRERTSLSTIFMVRGDRTILRMLYPHCKTKAVVPWH